MTKNGRSSDEASVPMNGLHVCLKCNSSTLCEVVVFSARQGTCDWQPVASTSRSFSDFI